jgi:hypothetical protein
MRNNPHPGNEDLKNIGTLHSLSKSTAKHTSLLSECFLTREEFTTDLYSNQFKTHVAQLSYRIYSGMQEYLKTNVQVSQNVMHTANQSTNNTSGTF